MTASGSSRPRRVLVIGPGGAGKTTVARAMAEALDLPLVHLDRLYWHAGWNPTPEDEWHRMVDQLIAQEAWIMDGNYGGTLPARLAAADLVVFLDMPRATCLWSLLRRRVQFRGRARPDLPPGCDERLTMAFLWWVWTYRRRRRPDILERLAELRPTQRAVILRHRRDVRRFLDELQRNAYAQSP